MLLQIEDTAGIENLDAMLREVPGIGMVLLAAWPTAEREAYLREQRRADPEAVLCDEPTGNLDTANSAEILALLASLPEPDRRAVVMVTHDPAAARYGTRLVRIRDGLVESDEPVFERTR